MCVLHLDVAQESQRKYISKKQFIQRWSQQRISVVSLPLGTKKGGKHDSSWLTLVLLCYLQCFDAVGRYKGASILL